jgi:nitrite reductase/ring-hydroxylating ferredoxin subunit
LSARLDGVPRARNVLKAVAPAFHNDDWWSNMAIEPYGVARAGIASAITGEPEDIFSPAHYAGVRRPVAEATNLPPWCYTSPRFFRGEIERLFAKVWNFVGRAERIPGPGDYFAVDVATVPIIVVRGGDRRVRAFANTCRHRGCEISRRRGQLPEFRLPLSRLVLCPDRRSGRRADRHGRVRLLR